MNDTEELFKQTNNRKAIELFNRQLMQRKNADVDLRDDIAVRVLIAMIENTKGKDQREEAKSVIEERARIAYRFADAMMAAREGEKKATPEEVVKALQTPIHSIDIKDLIHAPELEPGCKVVGLDHGKIGAVTGKPSDMHGQIPVKWVGDTYSPYAKPENLEVVQRPLKDGDRVTMEGEAGTIEDVFPVRGMAIVKWGGRGATWELISSLELAK